MLMFVLGLLFISSLVQVHCDTTTTTTTNGQCTDLGFVEDYLSCSTCDQLETILLKSYGDGDATAVSQYISSCKSCCTVLELGDNEQKYKKAELIYDSSSVKGFQHISNFIKDKAKLYSQVLKLKERWGRRPELILKDENGKSVKKINIQGWETDQLEEFIKNKII